MHQTCIMFDAFSFQHSISFYLGIYTVWCEIFASCTFFAIVFSLFFTIRKDTFPRKFVPVNFSPLKLYCIAEFSSIRLIRLFHSQCGLKSLIVLHAPLRMLSIE